MPIILTGFLSVAMKEYGRFHCHTRRTVQHGPPPTPCYEVMLSRYTVAQQTVRIRTDPSEAATAKCVGA